MVIVKETLLLVSHFQFHTASLCFSTGWPNSVYLLGGGREDSKTKDQGLIQPVQGTGQHQVHTSTKEKAKVPPVPNFRLRQKL